MARTLISRVAAAVPVATHNNASYHNKLKPVVLFHIFRCFAFSFTLTLFCTCVVRLLYIYIHIFLFYSFWRTASRWYTSCASLSLFVSSPYFSVCTEEVIHQQNVARQFRIYLEYGEWHYLYLLCSPCLCLPCLRRMLALNTSITHWYALSSTIYESFFFSGDLYSDCIDI